LSTASSTIGPSKSQEEPTEPPNQGNSPPYIQDRISCLTQAFGKDWQIGLIIQIAKNVVRTTIRWPSEYEDHSIDPSYELQTCNLPNEPDHPGIVFAPDRKKHGFLLLAMPKALATVRDGKLEMLDSHHPVGMNRVWIIEPVGQLSGDAPEGALATYRLLVKRGLLRLLGCRCLIRSELWLVVDPLNFRRGSMSRAPMLVLLNVLSQILHLLR
jgi:hypothetical protein